MAQKRPFWNELNENSHQLQDDDEMAETDVLDRWNNASQLLTLETANQKKLHVEGTHT